EMEEADARLGELRLASDSISSESARLEHEIASMSDKLPAEEKRMYDGSIANAKELEALQHEIVSLKERRSRAEDDLLEEMVRKEDVEARAGQAQTEAEAARARVEEVGGDAVRELDTIAADLTAKRSEREALTPAFDEELLELYEDLRAQNDGIGRAAPSRGPVRAKARHGRGRDRGRGVPGLPREALGRRARPPEARRGREE